MKNLGTFLFFLMYLLPIITMIYGYFNTVHSKILLGLIITNWVVLAVNEHLGAYPFTINEKKKFMFVFGGYVLVTTALVNEMNSGHQVDTFDWKVAMVSTMIFGGYSIVKPSFREKLQKHWYISLGRKK